MERKASRIVQAVRDLILLILSIVFISTTIRPEKKTLEERMKHPAKPITSKYRVFVGAGVLVMFVAILFSWFNNISFPLIGVYLRTVDLSEASNLVSNPIGMIFGFLALVGVPISLILGFV